MGEDCTFLPAPMIGRNANEQAMHEGVVRDMEQQRVKRERQLDFDMQKALEKEYKQFQTVKESPIDEGANAAPPR